MLQALYEEFRIEILEKEDDDEELEMGAGTLTHVVYWLFKILLDDDIREHTLKRVERVIRPIIEKEGDHEVERVREFVAGRMGGERTLLDGD